MKIFVLISFFGAIWLPILASAVASQPIRVMIDPGHGGDDEGAAQSQLKEKDLTLAVALLLKHELDNDHRFIALLTRSTDEFISLQGRSEKAKEEKADLFLSIHANSSPVTTAKGTEFYFENQLATDDETMALANRENSAKVPGSPAESDQKTDLENILTDLNHHEHLVLSQQLSQALLNAFQAKLKIKTRAIRQAPFHVLSVPMAATLVELGFLSNPEEAQWLNQRETQKKIAQALHTGLKSFKEKLDKVHRSTIN